MAVDPTVEWGEERRARLLDRIFGDPASRSPERRLSLPAVACAVVAAALFAVAEALPWITVKSVGAPGDESASVRVLRDASIEAVGNGSVTAYYIGIVLLFMVVGSALMARPHGRRLLVAAGFGIAVGLLIVLVGLISKAGMGGDLPSFYTVEADATAAPYVAIAAVVAAAAALALTGWHPRASLGRRRPATMDLEEDPESEPGPIDLTVTSA
jgi:hypothetical protein